jgi:hypothetical protein
MKTLNSRTRRSMEVQDPSSASGVRNVVSSTSQRLRPSTPTWYEMP